MGREKAGFGEDQELRVFINDRKRNFRVGKGDFR